MFDPAQYLEMKDSVIDMAVDDGKATVTKKAYDRDTGERADTEVTVDLADLQQRINDFQDFIDNAKAFLAVATKKGLDNGQIIEDMG